MTFTQRNIFLLCSRNLQLLKNRFVSSASFWQYSALCLHLDLNWLLRLFPRAACCSKWGSFKTTRGFLSPQRKINARYLFSTFVLSLQVQWNIKHSPFWALDAFRSCILTQEVTNDPKHSLTLWAINRKVLPRKAAHLGRLHYKGKAASCIN